MGAATMVAVLAIGCAAASRSESPSETTPSSPVSAAPQTPVAPAPSPACPATGAADLLARAPAAFAFRDDMAPNDERTHFIPYGGFVDPRQDAPTMWGIGEATLATWTRNVSEIVGDTAEDGQWLVVIPACVPNVDARLRTNDFDNMHAGKLVITPALRDRATAMLVDQAPTSVRATFSRRTAKRGGIEPAAFRVLATNVPGCTHVVALMADLGGMEHLGGVLCFAADDTAGPWLAAPTVGLDPHVIAATDLDGDGIDEILLHRNLWEGGVVTRWHSEAFVADARGKLTTLAMLDSTR